MPRSSAILASLAACAALASCTSPSAQDEPRRPTWSDEFDGPAGALPDPESWSFETFGDGSGNQELQCYTSVPGNTSTDGQGHLVITAIKQPGHRCVDGHVNDYTSGRITTQGKVEQRYGRLEVRAKVPSGAGIWPAFWALGANKPQVGWPAAGEIDVMEFVGRAPNEVLGTVHSPDPQNQRVYVNRRTTVETPLSDGFHVYAVEWTPDRFEWFLDDRSYGRVTREDVEAAGGSWAVYDKPFYLLLNLAVGGNLGGAVDPATTWPKQYVVDYVRVYDPDDDE